MSLTIEKCSPIGAKIVGAEIDQLLNDESVPDQIHELLEADSVLVFPEISFDDAEQVAFSSRIGEVSTGKAYGSPMGRDKDRPEIYFVGFGPDLKNELLVKGSFIWHLDGTTDPVPNMATLLEARSLSTNGGGDTQFVSTYAAYDRLSDEEQERFADLKVEHSAEAAYRCFDPDPTPEMVERLRQAPTKVHPLVWTHRTGRKSLVIGATAGAVVGMDQEEGLALLQDLLARATEPSQVFTYEWTVGDLVLWDNRGTLHRAVPYTEDSGRMMHRTSLIGNEPIQ
jgi:alpha-ketoglutarate-dependent taurine dioxygenase